MEERGRPLRPPGRGAGPTKAASRSHTIPAPLPRPPPSHLQPPSQTPARIPACSLVHSSHGNLAATLHIRAAPPVVTKNDGPRQPARQGPREEPQGPGCPGTFRSRSTAVWLDPADPSAEEGKRQVRHGDAARQGGRGQGHEGEAGSRYARAPFPSHIQPC